MKSERPRTEAERSAEMSQARLEQQRVSWCDERGQLERRLEELEAEIGGASEGRGGCTDASKGETKLGNVLLC